MPCYYFRAKSNLSIRPTGLVGLGVLKSIKIRPALLRLNSAQPRISLTSVLLRLPFLGPPRHLETHGLCLCHQVYAIPHGPGYGIPERQLPWHAVVSSA